MAEAKLWSLKGGIVLLIVGLIIGIIIGYFIYPATTSTAPGLIEIYDMAEEQVKSELKVFLNDTIYYLGYTIANLGNLLPNKKEYLEEVGSSINKAWINEIRPKFDDLTKKIDEVKVKDLESVGFIGFQWELKLKQWQWRKNRINDAIKTEVWEKIRTELLKGLKFIENILDSLKQIITITGFHAIDEFIRTIADILED